MADGSINEVPARRMASVFPKRIGLISHERAREAAMRLIHSHFGSEPHAQIHIPALVDDDDVVIMDYIAQQMNRSLPVITS